MSDAINPVLVFEGVSAEGSDGQALLRSAGLRLAAGEAVLVEADEAQRMCLADLAGGLSAPESGSVCFAGRCWLDMPPPEQSRQRRKIGWIFPEPAWLYNLDIDENATLSERFHGDRPPQEIAEEAAALTRSFGLEALPHIRPAWASARERLVSQWVRALLGTPHLLIVDSGAERADDSDFDALWKALDSRREQGLAVLWLAHRNPAADKVSQHRASGYIVREGTLEQIS